MNDKQDWLSIGILMEGLYKLCARKGASSLIFGTLIKVK